MARYPDKIWTVDSLKRQFEELHSKRVPTVDPLCPPAVCCAKQIRRAIINRMDGTNLNSEEVNGGEELVLPSLNESDNDDNLLNANEDNDDGKFGVGDVEVGDVEEVGDQGSRPTSRASGTVDGSVADVGDEAGGSGRRIAYSFISSPSTSSSSMRHRTSTHITTISRPRTQQWERSPDATGNRISNYMAMMMMNQALDSDKRSAERQKSHQEFCLQLEMQRQQMQQQQNMMALITTNMMGQNNIQDNNNIMSTLLGSNQNYQQHHNEEGGQSNQQNNE
jgi:hypothetical protein